MKWQKRRLEATRPQTLSGSTGITNTQHISTLRQITFTMKKFKEDQGATGIVRSQTRGAEEIKQNPIESPIVVRKARTSVVKPVIALHELRQTDDKGSPSQLVGTDLLQGTAASISRHQ